MTAPPPNRPIGEALLWLSQPDDHWSAHQEWWARNEARLAGGERMLEELEQFDNETDESFDFRKRTARYYNIPDKHMSKISGLLIANMPEPSYGSLGQPREREEIGSSTPNLAELLKYNCDGIGQDGTQLRAWVDGIVKRAGATNYRAILVEMPRETTLAAIRQRQGRPVTGPQVESDRAGGWHAYFVEYSPLAWIRRVYTEGRLDLAVLKIKVPARSGFVTEETAFYVMVRDGYVGPPTMETLAPDGRRWSDGGWWIIAENDHEVLAKGDWAMTRGQIPLVRAMDEHSLGTHLHPSFGRALTMELGQIAVDLMNARSEQRHNARQAAKTLLLLLGADPAAQKATADQVIGGSMIAAVPPVEMPDGSKVIPTVWSGSSVALDTSVYSAIISEAINEAREIMVSQISSTPDASGESKMAGFEEAVSPLLARMAAAMENWLNSLLYFYALRNGVTPDASITMPSRFKLRDVLSDVDDLIATMKESLLDSPTLSKSLLLRKADEQGLIEDSDRSEIEKELNKAIENAGVSAVAEYWMKMSEAITKLTAIGGMTPQGAGFLLGLTPEQVDVLRTGTPPGEVNDGANATPTAAEKAQQAADRMEVLRQGNGQQPPPSSNGAEPEEEDVGPAQQAQRRAAFQARER